MSAPGVSVDLEKVEAVMRWESIQFIPPHLGKG